MYYQFVVLHQKKQLNLINKETLEYLPQGAVVTNVARGDIVNDEALIDALIEEKFMLLD